MPEIDHAHLLRMPESDYMNDEQRGFFERLLRCRRHESEARLAEIRNDIHARRCWGDAMDRAVAEGNQAFLAQQAERESIHLARLEAALERLRRGAYGYCLETGEPIGLRRLLLDPATEYSLAVQARLEKPRR